MSAYLNAQTLARDEIEILRRHLKDDAVDEEQAVQIEVLCNMALECMEARLKAFSAL